MIIDDITDRMYVRYNFSNKKLELAMYIDCDDCICAMDMIKKIISETDLMDYKSGQIKFERFGAKLSEGDELFPNGWVYVYGRKNDDTVLIMPMDIFDVFICGVVKSPINNYLYWDNLTYAIIHRHESTIKCRFIDGRIKIVKRPPPELDFPCIKKYDDGTEIRWVR